MKNFNFNVKKIKEFGVKNFVLERALPFTLGAIMLVNLFGKDDDKKLSRKRETNKEEISELSDMAALEEQAVSMKEYRASDYKFVYINGNVYLTQETSTYLGCDVYLKYFDVVSHELVGFVQKNEKQYNFLDRDFLGVGYGKEIPEGAVIPVSSVIATEYFDDTVYNYFVSNSRDLVDMLDNRYIEEKPAPFLPKEKNNRLIEVFQSDDEPQRGPVVKTQKFSLYSDKLDKITLIGVRLSANQNDVRYNYVYDYLTGNIYGLTLPKYSHVIVENVDLSWTIKELKKYSDVCYSIDDLYVFDTTLGNVTNVIGKKEDFYYLNLKEKLDDKGIGKSYVDVMHDNAVVYQYKDNGTINYYNHTENIFIDAVMQDSDKTIVPMTDFLESHGLEPFIQNTISRSEINDITVYLEAIRNGETIELASRPATLNLSVKDEEIVSADDLVVIDPLAEGITIIGEDCKKYYFVKFEKIDSQEDVFYKDIYDDTGLAVISTNGDWMFYDSTSINLDGSVIDIRLPMKDLDMGVRKINDFLAEKGLDYFIKDSYTGRDIANIYEYVMNNTLNKSR